MEVEELWKLFHIKDKGVRSTLSFCEIVNVYGTTLRLTFVRSVNI